MITGFKKVCGKNNGGVLTIGLIEAENFTGATVDSASNGYSALTLASQKYFKKYEFMEDEAEFKEDTKFENGSASVTKSIIFKIPGMNGESGKAVQEIIDASYCGLIAVVTTPAGKTFLVGYGEDVKKERPLKLTQSAGTTGKKLTDAHGEEITIACEHTEKSRVYSGDLEDLFAPPAES